MTHQRRFDPDEYEDDFLTPQDIEDAAIGFFTAAAFMVIPSIAFIYWLFK